MMIAFSTQPGNVALDGEGRNSPFTGALLRHIGTEGLSINDVMIDVRNDVLKATDGKQVPWENSSLTGQFFFKPAAPPTVADKTAEAAAQIAALRKEIDKLQADQGARLAAQQEQLEILQQKLESETKTASQLAAKTTDEAPATAPNRVIAVEPASDAKPEPDVAAADTKVATAETSAEPGKAPEVVPPLVRLCQWAWRVRSLPKTSFQSSRTSIVIVGPSTDRGDGQRKTLWSVSTLLPSSTCRSTILRKGRLPHSKIGRARTARSKRPCPAGRRSPNIRQ